MPGGFRIVEEKPFPGTEHELQCRVYEWHARVPPRRSDLRVRFLCPLEDGPREFYVESVLDSWLSNSKANSLEKICRAGIKVLAELEGDSPCFDRKESQFFLSLFRNRNQGHIGVSRQFNHALDFVGRSERGRSLLLPGTDVHRSPQELASQGKIAAANRMLGQGIRQLTNSVSDGQPCVSDALSAIEDAIQSLQSKKKPRPFVRRNEIDHLLVFGESDGVNYSDVEQMVRSSLIAGPVEHRDVLEAISDKRQFADFFRRVQSECDRRKPKDFDKWLQNQRQHGFVRLMRGGAALRGSQKDLAKHRAQRMFRVMLWSAYQQMARCYGAAMSIVYANFCCDLEPEPNPLERFLFLQRNMPMAYLAGLPVNFLGRAQLRWIVRPLTRLWHDAETDFSHYSLIPNLLNVYGYLIRARREADRMDVTNGDSGPLTNDMPDKSEASNDISFSDESTAPVLQLSSTSCPTCGNTL